MFLIGLVTGILTAILQSVSYVCSAAFLNQNKSSLQLAVFSQIAMGMICLPFLPFFFPREIFEGKTGSFFTALLLWIAVFAVGQICFFATLNRIESSRASSLLGLKILFLAVIYVIITREMLSWLQWFSVILCTIAAVGMNWSGGKKITVSGILPLCLTVIFYCFADMLETHMVRIPASGDIIRDTFGISLVCYSVLGLFSLPLLLKFKMTGKQFLMACPFAVTWYLSQFTLFICFGTVGTVFGNVLLSARGIFSVFAGMILLAWGLERYDAKISIQMWARRIVFSVMMTAAIILFSMTARPS